MSPYREIRKGPHVHRWGMVIPASAWRAPETRLFYWGCVDCHVKANVVRHTAMELAWLSGRSFPGTTVD